MLPFVIGASGASPALTTRWALPGPPLPVLAVATVRAAMNALRLGGWGLVLRRRWRLTAREGFRLAVARVGGVALGVRTAAAR